MAVGVPTLNAAEDSIDLRFRSFCKRSDLSRGRQIKQGCPGVGHPYGIKSVDGSAAYGLGRHMAGRSGSGTIGGNKIKIFRLKGSLFQKFLHQAGQAPEIGGENDTYGAFRKIILLLMKAVQNGYSFLIIRGGQPLGHIFAVARGRKIQEHALYLR